MDECGNSHETLSYSHFASFCPVLRCRPFFVKPPLAMRGKSKLPKRLGHGLGAIYTLIPSQPKMAQYQPI